MSFSYCEIGNAYNNKVQVEANSYNDLFTQNKEKLLKSVENNRNSYLNETDSYELKLDSDNQKGLDNQKGTNIADLQHKKCNDSVFSSYDTLDIPSIATGARYNEGVYKYKTNTDNNNSSLDEYYNNGIESVDNSSISDININNLYLSKLNKNNINKTTDKKTDKSNNKEMYVDKLIGLIRKKHSDKLLSDKFKNILLIILVGVIIILIIDVFFNKN